MGQLYSLCKEEMHGGNKQQISLPDQGHPGAGAGILAGAVPLPHIGSAGVDTRYKMARMAAEDLVRVLNGEQPLHPVPL